MHGVGGELHQLAAVVVGSMSIPGGRRWFLRM